MTTELKSLLEQISDEITVINKAAGETRFNPSLTSELRAILYELKTTPLPQKGDNL